MTDILEAVANATNHSQALLDEAAALAEDRKKRNKMAQAQSRAQRRIQLRRKEKRLSKALAGITALLHFGKMPQMQELLRLRYAIKLHVTEDSFVDGAVYLTQDSVSIEIIEYGIAYGNCGSILGRASEDTDSSIRISLRTTDTLLNARIIKPIFSMKVLDLSPAHNDRSDEAQYRRVELKNALAHETLFQFLVDCAKPDKFERYLRAALT